MQPIAKMMDTQSGDNTEVRRNLLRYCKKGSDISRDVEERLHKVQTHNKIRVWIRNVGSKENTANTYFIQQSFIRFSESVLIVEQLKIRRVNDQMKMSI